MVIEQLSLFGEPVAIEHGHLPQTDLNTLYSFAKEQALLHWNREFDIEIELVNTPWRRTRGMYIQNIETGRNWIRMSRKTNTTRSWEDVKGTLLHELVHWHLHTSDMPYRDRDIEFARECLRVGAPISGSKIARKTADGIKNNT